ncbi:MAG TPA: divergent polysaccharide deacetylase family protein [Candidatus Bathyarchaeia archaeon]|nr:divergent polysaccharide deacetylase family protein [Candidatus Bathyarchaeia archaeon]
MSKRPLPKRREPWPAFTLLAAVLAALAILCVVWLDELNARHGQPAYIFRPPAGAGAPKAAGIPAPPPERPTEKYPAAAPSRPAAPQPAARPFGEVVAASLSSAGVSEDSVLELRDPKGRPLFEVELPAELYESVAPAIERTLKAEGVRVLGKKKTTGEDRTEVLWSLRRPSKEDAAISFVLPSAPPPAALAAREPARTGPRGQVALIMDDMGQSLETLDELIALKRPITVSVLPYSAFAAETARTAHEKGLEVLLHLPLESINNHEAMANTEGMILTVMTEPAIVASFEASYDRVPFAAGTNNHMGSRFTADRDLMRLILRPIKERGLFFVDSRTTAQTVALDEARRMGIPAAQRDVFLDADEDRGRIKGRLIELLQKARKKGRAVGICHPFPETLAVLKSSLFLVDSYNLEVVPISRLVR